MSANSEDALKESYVLILKLKDRTRQGKIAWSSVERLGSISAEILRNATSAFQTKLGSNLVAIAWENGAVIGFDLIELDFSQGPPTPPHLEQPSKDYERIVLAIVLKKESASSGTITDESVVFEDLTELLSLVHRAPVQSDVRIEQAKNYLDELAS